MRPSELVRELSERLQLSALQVDQSGQVDIYFDQIRVSLLFRGNLVCLQSDICKCVEDEYEQTELLRGMMRMQAGRVGDPWQARESLTINPEKRQIMLLRILTAERIDGTVLIEALEAFVTAAEFWQEALAGAGNKSSFASVP